MNNNKLTLVISTFRFPMFPFTIRFMFTFNGINRTPSHFKFLKLFETIINCFSVNTPIYFIKK